MRFLILNPLIRLFLDFFLKLSTGFCLLVSSLHEAGSLLLFFFTPSRFLLPFLEGFTHKNSFSVMVPRSQRYVPYTAFFLSPACLFRKLRAWSTCSSAALFVSPITSAISQISILLALSSISRSRGDNVLASF